MSNTYSHAPFFVVRERHGWGDATISNRDWHARALPAFRKSRAESAATRDSRRSDRHAARQSIRAGRFDDLATRASFAGETRNARRRVWVAREW